MAPVQTELQVEVHNSTDVINLVHNEATWRDLLVDLVNTNKLDPWDIDIVELVSKYLETVKKLQVLDLKIPANIMLATSILVRLKSDAISFQDYTDEGELAEGAGERPNIIVDPLNFRLRLPPKRKISLSELITALDEAIKIKEERAVIIPKQQISLPISVENFDIEAETEKLYGVINKNVDKSNMITFTRLFSVSDSNDIMLGIFIPLLFLAHNEKIGLIQEKFFSEIIIVLK